ncbi:hypothetical protein E2C01_083785 [Portunus trituberculatus]|uniref:Uncharacterized protein n=1 Tax=Portunus trituberculatus TaxID=210409 RepID=A0A5B7J348_PORTR|nr:hypothetical protein [Portunus trituberculatus]
MSLGRETGVPREGGAGGTDRGRRKSLSGGQRRVRLPRRRTRGAERGRQVSQLGAGGGECIRPPSTVTNG